VFESYVAPAAAMIAAACFSLLLWTSAAAAQSQTPRARHADGAIVERGDSGGTVAKVQRALRIDDDGIFGTGTVRAVKALQSSVDLPRTGKVDRRTWRALFRAPVGSAGAGDDDAGGSGGAPPAPQPPAPATSPPGACSAALATPLRGATQTSGFGDGRHHAGIDLAAPVGTPVRAAACGIVEFAGTESGYGRMVCVRHSATFVTCYAHLSSIARGVGAVIARGQVIGRVGMTGRTSGPHLHFETRVDGTARDPAPYLAGTRALPS
jgi:murein DD-endopeptidase MepM/ murein hydrolase activator NlpD